jgi:WD40 repeat protein
MDLLPVDHRGLFGAVVDRLTARRPSARALLEALALARGRGLPRVDRTWLIAANALDHGEPVHEQDIDDLLTAAAPYIMLDAERGQSVYRLAHQTFAEHFLADTVMRDTGERHRRITTALIAAAAGSLPVPPNSYIVFHLAEHAGEALAWRELTDAGPLLDHLDPDSVAAMVLKYGFGRDDVPTELAAFALAHHLMAGVPPPDRATVRAAAEGRLRGIPMPTGNQELIAAAVEWHLQGRRPNWAFGFVNTVSREGRVVAGWAVDRKIFIGFDRGETPESSPESPSPAARSTAGASELPESEPALRWTRLRREKLHTALPGHSGPVRTMAALRLPDGRTLLASGGDDATVRLWDPLTASAAGAPLAGHTGSVRALAAVSLRDGRTVLASGGDDGTVRLWDPVAGQPIGRPLTGHRGPVRALAAVPLVDGRTVVASGGHDKTVRLWDPVTGQPIGKPLTGHTHPVASVAAVLLPNGESLLVSCDDRKRSSFDRGRSLRFWDPARGVETSKPTSIVGADTTFFPVRAVAELPMADGPTGLVIAGYFVGMRVMVWDPAEDRYEEFSPYQAHFDDPKCVLVFALPARRLLVAAADWSKISLWEVGRPGSDSGRDTLREVGNPFADQADGVEALASVPLADERVLLASASNNGVVRLWDPAGEACRASAGMSEQGSADSAPGPGIVVDPRALLVTSVAVLPAPGGTTLLATGCLDETTRLWNATNGDVVGGPLRTQPAPVRPDLATWFTNSAAVASVPLPDGRVVLATGSGRSIRLWDPVTATPLSEAQHVCRLPGILWDRQLQFKRWLLGRLSDRAPVAAMTVARLGADDVRLVVGTGRAVQFWQVTQQGQLRRIRGVRARHSGPVRAVAAATLPDGRVVVASGGDDATVRRWDPATGKQLGSPMRGHATSVRALAAHSSPDGTTILVSGGDDGTLRTWDLERGAATGSPVIVTGSPVRAVAEVVAGEPLLASAGADGVLRLWRHGVAKQTRAIPLGIAITSMAAHDGVLYAGSADGLLAFRPPG